MAFDAIVVTFLTSERRLLFKGGCLLEDRQDKVQVRTQKKFNLHPTRQHLRARHDDAKLANLVKRARFSRQVFSSEAGK